MTHRLQHYLNQYITDQTNDISRQLASHKMSAKKTLLSFDKTQFYK